MVILSSFEKNQAPPTCSLSHFWLFNYWWRTGAFKRYSVPRRSQALRREMPQVCEWLQVTDSWPLKGHFLVWCLHSANFAFVSPVKVSPHYKSHLRSHTSSAQSPVAKIWESQWEAPASYATCYHKTINDWSHDNNHQTTNTLTEQLHLMLLQKSETFLHDVWSWKQTEICSEENVTDMILFYSF